MAARSMAARNADGLRSRPKVGALKSGCGWMAEPGVFMEAVEAGPVGRAPVGGARRGASRTRAPSKALWAPGPRPRRTRARPAGGPDPAGSAQGWERGWGWCRPSFQGWRRRRGESNCAVVGAGLPGELTRAEAKRACAGEADGGGERRRERKRQKWRDPKRKTHRETDVEGETHAGRQRHRG